MKRMTKKGLKNVNDKAITEIATISIILNRKK